MSLTTVWWPEASEDLRRLRSWVDAGWIDSEVQRYAEDGVGDLRRVILPSGRRGYALFLPGYRVVVSYDRTSRTLHVWRVLRSLPTG
jgi:hypothetical protein